MRIIRVVLLTLLCAACSSEEPAPSCSQAFMAYYGAGCSFIDLQTNQPVPLNQIIAECQMSSTPERCQDEEDDLLRCLERTTPAEECDCTQEQMALIRCD